MEKRVPLLSLEEQRQLFGPYDRHVRQAKDLCGVSFVARDGTLKLVGPADSVTRIAGKVDAVLEGVRKGTEYSAEQVERLLFGDAAAGGERDLRPQRRAGDRSGDAPNLPRPRTRNQELYLQAMREADLVLASGPAGTGKTFLAVAAAVRSLREGEVERLILTRPAVEAGEHLGFLPGDFEAKIDPYLRPLYDALHDMLGPAGARRLKDLEVVEIAPLAFMRGRTLNKAFVILDEAQNATVGQLKMFLTRLGEGSRAVVTGDRTQTDLPAGKSGLDDALVRLRDVVGVRTLEFEQTDIQRSLLVQRVVAAYGDIV